MHFAADSSGVLYLALGSNTSASWGQRQSYEHTLNAVA